VLYAFDLIELDGSDLRDLPIETRKATLASLLRNPGALRLSEHISADGPEVFAHACRLGVEGRHTMPTRRDYGRTGSSQPTGARSRRWIG
jgi:bifunctional non-homologous end joining protein LigD